MKINFKSDDLADEWQALSLLNPGLMFRVMSFAAGMPGETITITSILRKDDKGVHGVWRGVDVRTSGLDAVKVAAVVKKLNSVFKYDPKRPAMVTFMVHDVGQGNHLHIQNMK